MSLEMIQAGFLWKIAACGVPLSVGCYVAQELAHRGGMPRAATAWGVAARIVVAIILLLLLSQLLLWAMGC
jgi:hypothetical protein